MYVPDNYDTFVIRESEQERIKKLHKRMQLEINEEEYKEDLECQHCMNSQDNTKSY